MTDRHVRRLGQDYGDAFLTLLPQGQAWPKAPGTTLDLACRGLAEYWGFVDGRAADLLETESDPRKTMELLPDWERAWGLPDPCFPEPLTMEQRRIVLVQRMTLMGGASRQFFYEVAEQLGYSIRIIERRPWQFGISETGDTRVHGWPKWEIGPPELRYAWIVQVTATSLSWWRYGTAELGVDPHLDIGRAENLECVFNRWKPAHTKVFFDYSDVV